MFVGVLLYSNTRTRDIKTDHTLWPDEELVSLPRAGSSMTACS
jgi:hypothetical protein